MSSVLKAIAFYAAHESQRLALQGEDVHEHYSYAELKRRIDVLSNDLRRLSPSCVAVLADNRPATAILDLALMQAGIVSLPLPLFFTAAQRLHALQTAGVSHLFVDRAETLALFPEAEPLPSLSSLREMSLVQYPASDAACKMPEACLKVTFTSGSTAEPKGVCLSLSSMESVAVSLAEHGQQDDRHLCLLPYATLLENIAGFYVPLLSGASLCLPGLATIGLQGSSGLQAEKMLAALQHYRATSCVMIPQMLQGLLFCLSQGMPKPDALRMIAVGGSPVSLSLLKQAEDYGLPVFEGYGFSESASVVSFNTPEASRMGSVGKPLPHIDCRVADDGELWVKGSLLLSYLGDDHLHPADEYWPSGDMAHIDDDGFIYLTGRKKHIFITSFGRNVSPEWLEGELMAEPAIAQACVFGEARPFNLAVVTARDPHAIEAALQRVNDRLPDYAKIHRYILTREPFSVENKQLTGTSRPRRSLIQQAYTEQIERVYQEST